MFEKIILRRSTSGPALTMGELAEALLFYQNVHLVLDYGSLCSFIDAIRMEGLISLLKRKNVTAVYCEETLAVSTTKEGAMSYHRPIGFWLSGNEHGVPANNRRERLLQVLSRYGYDKKTSQKLADCFIALVPNRKLTGNDFVKGGVIHAATEDFLSSEFALSAARKILSLTPGVPALNDNFKLEIHQSGEDFLVFSNLDIAAINRSRKTDNPDLGDFSHASLLNDLLHARADTHLAARYGGEFHTSDLVSEVIRLKHETLLRRIGLDREELGSFNELVLPNTPKLSEVINSGEQTFTDFLKLLDKSQRFREWIQGVNPDEKIVSEYLKDVTSEGWISKLPGKTLRYVLGTAIGATGTIPGLLFSAADTYLVDKMLGGWRPSHFINKTYKPFLGKQ